MVAGPPKDEAPVPVGAQGRAAMDERPVALEPPLVMVTEEGVRPVAIEPAKRVVTPALGATEARLIIGAQLARSSGLETKATTVATVEPSEAKTERPALEPEPMA